MHGRRFRQCLHVLVLVCAGVATAAPALDVDGDGKVGALSDGLMILRYAFGFRGDVVTAGAKPANAPRSASAIAAYLDQLTSPASSQSAIGIWDGALVGIPSYTANVATCIVTVEGELGCALLDSTNNNIAAMVHGTIAVVDDRPSGAARVYAAVGYHLADGSNVADFAIVGGAVRTTRQFAFSALGAGDINSGATVFNPIFNRGSSLPTLAGTWAGLTITGQPATFSITSDGVLRVQEGSGCRADGTVAVIDPLTNGYRVAATVSNCLGLNGSYSGLAVLTDSVNANDTLVFGIFNQGSSIFGAPRRL